MVTLETSRLQLRPFNIYDADPLAVLADDRRVAASTGTLPFPYKREHASEWIAKHAEWWLDGTQSIWAINVKAAAEAGPGTQKPRLIGAIGLIHDRRHVNAEMGYWIGHASWGQGFATEAARAVVAWAFDDGGVHRLYGQHFATNPASGRVLEKCGMKKEGLLRRHFVRFEVAQDVVVYGILKDEWEASAR
ncbi:MAG: GNAT family N-acetyltransferase [Spirochaetes bacterium]|nr:GNAT family N-acetyltransferase [Spirochaetota bacterium]